MWAHGERSAPASANDHSRRQVASGGGGAAARDPLTPAHSLSHPLRRARRRRAARGPNRTSAARPSRIALAPLRTGERGATWQPQSPASTRSAPQSALHRSPSSVLPSSHDSPLSTTPSPQVATRQLVRQASGSLSLL